MVDKYKDPSDLNTLLSLNVADFVIVWDDDEVGVEKMKVITFGNLSDQISSPLDTRITANEAELADHETRITTNEGDIAAIEGRLGTSTDNKLTRYDGTDSFQGSGVTLDDSNNISGIGTLSTTGAIDVNGETVWHSGNDGSGSGLDADTIDGVDSTQFLRSDQDDSTTGSLDVGNRISSGIATITTSQTDIDVSDLNHLKVDTSSGDVTLSGLQQGIAGQRLSVFKSSALNTLTISHMAGVGTQDIYTVNEGDISITSYGGVDLECDGTSWFVVESGAGGSAQSPEADIYSDILNDSKYEFLTYDAFQDESLVDTGNTTMTFNLADSQYEFVTTQVLQSNNLFDSVSGLSSVTEALIEVLYTDSGTPTIEATADGTNWETITPGEIHEFTNTGTTLKLRFTAGGSGQVTSWGIFYGPDSSITTVISNQKVVNFYYEATAVDEDIVIDGHYFESRVGISAITINARVAPAGANLTVDILRDGSEDSKVATLTDGSTYEKTSYTAHAYFNTDERFGLKIKQVGSSEAGQGLNVTISYYDR